MQTRRRLPSPSCRTFWTRSCARHCRPCVRHFDCSAHATEVWEGSISSQHCRVCSNHNQCRWAVRRVSASRERCDTNLLCVCMIVRWFRQSVVDVREAEWRVVPRGADREAAAHPSVEHVPRRVSGARDAVRVLRGGDAGGRHEHATATPHTTRTVARRPVQNGHTQHSDGAADGLGWMDGWMATSKLHTQSFSCFVLFLICAAGRSLLHSSRSAARAECARGRGGREPQGGTATER